MPLLSYGFDGFIASSGGFVCCGDHILSDQPMTAEQQKTAMSVLESAGISRIAESKDYAFADERYLVYLKEKLLGNGQSEMSRWRTQLRENMGLLPMAEYAGQPLYKIVLLADSQNLLEQSCAALQDRFSLVVQGCDEQGNVNGELLPRTFDKGIGIRMICDHLAIEPGCCFGYGDSMNDRELLQTVGHGVAMGNACADLKAMADEVCPPVDRDGLYLSFEKNGLFS